MIYYYIITVIAAISTITALVLIREYRDLHRDHRDLLRVSIELNDEHREVVDELLSLIAAISSIEADYTAAIAHLSSLRLKLDALITAKFAATIEHLFSAVGDRISIEYPPQLGRDYLVGSMSSPLLIEHVDLKPHRIALHLNPAPGRFTAEDSNRLLVEYLLEAYVQHLSATRRELETANLPLPTED